MVPKGWNILSLRDLVDFTNGKAHENDVDECGQFVLVNSKFISTGGTVFKKTDSAHCPASEGDILMVMSDVPNGKAIAKCFYVTKNNEYTVNQRIARLRAIACDSHFLYYSLDRNKYYLKFDDGVKQTNLRKDEVLDCPIKVPPLPEQNKIAKILSTWDQAISTTEQLLVNSQQQKKALMQQLLTGKKRLLDKNGVRFSGEWKKCTLGKLGDTFNGLTGKTKDDFGFGKKYIPYINIFKNSRIDVNALELVDVKEGESQSLSQYGDIFFTTSSETPDEVGMSSVLLDHVDELYLNSFCFGYRLFGFESLQPEYARYLLRSEHVRGEIAVLGQGATRYNLSKKQLMKLEVTLPLIDEQKKIASVLSSADQEIETLQSQLNGLKQEKKALMQALLTGKRRVQL